MQKHRLFDQPGPQASLISKLLIKSMGGQYSCQASACGLVDGDRRPGGWGGEWSQQYPALHGRKECLSSVGPSCSPFLGQIPALQRP